MVKKSFMEKVTVGLGFENSDFGRQIGGKTCQTDDWQYKDWEEVAGVVCFKKNE